MNRSFRFALTAYVVMLGSIVPAIYLNVFSGMKMDSLSRTLVGQSIELIVILVFVTVVRRWNGIGLHKGFHLKSLTYLLPLLLLIVLLLMNGIKAREPSRILSFLLLALITGFCEETMFRGMIYGSLRKNGQAIALLTSSALFGLAHTLNLFTGVDMRLVLLDVLATFGFGLVFSIAYEYTGTLLPLILVHAMIDFSSYLSRDYIMAESPASYTMESALPNLILALVLITWSAFVLLFKKRKSRIAINK